MIIITTIIIAVVLNLREPSNKYAFDEKVEVCIYD